MEGSVRTRSAATRPPEFDKIVLDTLEQQASLDQEMNHSSRLQDEMFEQSEEIARLKHAASPTGEGYRRMVASTQQPITSKNDLVDQMFTELKQERESQRGN